MGCWGTYSALNLIRLILRYFHFHVITLSIYIWYGIYHWRRLFRSSYGKLIWLGFGPNTTTEFSSGAPTDWTNRPWDRLTHRANFVPLIQPHILFNLQILNVECWRVCQYFKMIQQKYLTITENLISYTRQHASYTNKFFWTGMIYLNFTYRIPNVASVSMKENKVTQNLLSSKINFHGELCNKKCLRFF